MSLTFTLKDNITANSRVDKYSIVHKLKNTDLLDRLPQDEINAMKKMWLSNRGKVLKEFEIRTSEYFSMEEIFGLIVPPTNRGLFTSSMKSSIVENFKQVVDISEYFSKEEGVSFGTPPFSEMSIEELRNYIIVNESLKEVEKLNRYLIIDDVYAKGKTMSVIKLILNELYGNEIEILSGTLIRTR